MKYLVLFLALGSTVTSCSQDLENRVALAGRAFYPALEKAGYAEPTNFSINKDSFVKGEELILSVREEKIYKDYYVTINGKWQRHSFPQTITGSNWISSSVSTSLNTSLLSEGTNYAVAYSCTKTKSTWGCHDNKWQIHQFHILPLPSSEPQCGSDQECPMNYSCINQNCFPDMLEHFIEPEDNIWENFPILMTNLNPKDLSDLTDLIDVGMYYTAFTPFDNAIHTLRIKRAVDMIDAAKANGLKVMINIGDIAHPYNVDQTKSDQWLKDNFPEVIGDGVREPLLDNNGQLTGYEFYDSTKKVKIPTDINEITADYINYRSPLDEQFLQYLIDYDNFDTIVGWYGAEEIRYYYTSLHRPLLGEYGLQVGFKKTIDKIDSKNRPLMGSLQHNWEPEITIPYTLLELGDDVIYSTSQNKEITLAQDQQKNLKELQQHIVHSNYLGLVLGDYGSTNRIDSYHTIQKGLKTIEYLKKIYQENNAFTGNNQQVPKHKVFHAPDLSQNGPAFMTKEHARHDFWSGVLDANGILIYNYAFADDYPDIWDEYKEGLTLIKKGGLRQYLVSGIKTTPTITVSKGKEIIPGNDYTTNGPWKAEDYPHLVLPDYPSVNARLFKIGDTGYIIVSHSYDQNIEFNINVDSPITSAQIVLGKDSPLSKNSQSITDSFTGIDARIYKVTFAN